jgi:hypothetical protein
LKQPPVKGAIFCLSYTQGNRRGHVKEEDGHGGNRTVVITAETEPNFTSGPAAWSPDEGKTWFKLHKVSGYWAVAFANPQPGWCRQQRRHSENQLLIGI